MKRVLAILLILMMLVSLVACGSNENKAIEDVITANAEAMEKEDVDAYMATVHGDDTMLEQTRSSMTMIFETYDLKVEVTKMEVLEVTDEEATIRVTQQTSNENDQPFDANEATAVHTLKFIDGKWKIVATALESVDAL